jgi:hypothetical protein
VYFGIGTDWWFFGFGFKEKLQIFKELLPYNRYRKKKKDYKFISVKFFDF